VPQANPEPLAYAAENIRQTTLHNAMPPHDSCYSRDATVST
jgi:hypothetical protein